VDRELELYARMLHELEQEDPMLAATLASEGATRPSLILGKYFVEGKRMKGILGEEL
jgi:hypothetical protein